MLRNINWPTFFLYLGVISIISQVVLLREITTLFYGNEMFYGVGLGLWMLATGLGSLISAKVIKKIPHTIISWLTIGSLFILLPLIIVALRWSITLTVPLGSIADLDYALLVSVLAILLYCFPLGVVFTMGVISWKKKQTANKAYLWETLGFGIGGLILTFIFATTMFPLGYSINKSTLQWKYPNIVDSFNTRYNQIIVEKNNDQQIIYTNGQVLFSTREPFESTKLVNLLLPFIKNPQNVLVSGDPNFAREFKKIISDSKVEFVEIDEKLLQFEKSFLGENIETRIGDPKLIVENSTGNFDLVVFSPGNPQTLLTNRLFTLENFANIHDKLSDPGIFALLVNIPTDYRSLEATKFTASIYQAFSQVFPNSHQLLALDDQLLFIGGKSNLSVHMENIDQDWQQMISWYVNDPRNFEIINEIHSVNAKTNTDINPSSFFYQQLFWQTMFNFNLPKVMETFSKMLPIGLVITIIFLLFRANKQIRLATIVASSSFILLSVEIVGIFLFQTFIGYLYSQIGLIFAGALVGMAVGVWFVEKLKKIPKNLLQISFLSYIVIFLLLIIGTKTNLRQLSFFWLGTIFTTGIIGGIVYALINKMYLAKFNNLSYVYAYDLFGAALGAFLTSSFFLPVFGLNNLFFYLSLISILNVIAIKN